MIRASLLISTYNWPEALDLVLKSVKLQSQLPIEVVIADDGSKPETKIIIEYYRTQLPIPIKHVWHEDIGFRKTIIMNQAISQLNGDYIIQIDGDIILHPRFIEDHVREAEIGFFIKGSRGRLTQFKSADVLCTKNISIYPFDKGVKSTINATRFLLASRLFFYKDLHKTRNLKGCNFAVWKKDFIAVNGYNNALTGWGHEDIELGARLVNLGIKRKHLKMTAVCYHIYHPLNSRAQEDDNFRVYENVVKRKTIRCTNGYEQVIESK